MPRMKTGYKRGIPHENVVGCKVKRCTFTTGGLGGAVLISKGCPVCAGWPFFVALILFFWGAKIFQIRCPRFVPRIADLVHNERKKLAQLCKRSLADALEER